MSHEPKARRVGRARIAYFLVVFPIVLLSSNFLVVLTWNHFWKLPHLGIWLAVTSLLTMAFNVTTILGLNHTSLLHRVTYQLSAIWLGILNYLLFAACLTWIFPTVTFYAFAALTAIFGLINARTLRVTRVTVELPNLPEHWRGRSFALVTDMHLGNVWQTAASRRVVTRLEKFPCAMILLGGDLFDGPKADLPALLAPWEKISGTTPIYFVSGNHEEYTGRAKYIEAVERFGIRVLNNEKVEQDGLQIMGVHDHELRASSTFRELLQKANLDRNRPTILLAHQPVNLDIAEDEGIALQLCGHTHGGQFWPWVHVAARVHGKFVAGLHRIGKLLVYTSNGVGTWGAPMRVGTKSEIILIQLEPTGP
jgi:predicted MPP superfamily phosphohydrolase